MKIMKKTTIILALCVLLSGCANNNTPDFITQNDLLESTTVVYDTIGSNAVNTDKSDISDIIENTSRDPINKFIDSIGEIRNSYEFGLLYDFDFDEFPEVITINYGMVNIEGEVYKFKDDQLVACGEIVIDDNYPLRNSMQIEVYFDEADNQYFYCSNPIDFVKNNSDNTTYGFYSGSLYKYTFYDDKIHSSILLSFQDNCENEDHIQKYITKCDEILNQYKKIATVPIVPMWNSKDIIDGTYKQIIFKELKSQ